MNGEPLKQPHYDGRRLFLPLEALRAGPTGDAGLRRPHLKHETLTWMEISFQHRYSQASHGLTRTVDAQDGEIYLSSCGEPFHANSILPLFDQPDLKAS